jgi:hypothetical protein
MKALSWLSLAQLALGALLLPGCFTTSVYSGKPGVPASIEYDEKWHHGVAWGIAELSGPYDLEEVCPNGWSEIKTETSFVNGFVDVVTRGIYAPQTVTVRCAVPATPAAPSPPAPPSPAALPSPPPAPQP